MTTWIFLPVPTQEMKNFASKLNLGPSRTLHNQFVSGAGKGITRFLGGCLNGVEPWDELLLICHGATGGAPFTGAQRSAHDLKKYDPAGLAKVIQAEGLTKSFVNLKLLICGGGLHRKGTGGAFAELTFQALRQAGYANVQVTGYLGDVATDGGKISVLRGGEQGGRYYDANLPASHKTYK